MNYSKIYNNIINIGKSRGINKPDGYYEYHHIVPKCLGGEDNEENLVWLTAKEHFICHALLCKIHTNISLIYAFNMMHVDSKFHVRYINSRLYEINRAKMSAIMRNRIISEETRLKMSVAKKGKPLLESHINNMKLAAKNKPPLSVESRLKISESNKGHSVSEELRKKISECHKGRVFTEEHKRKLSEKGKLKVLTKDHRDKISKAVSGENHGMFGRKHTEESKRKMSETRRLKNARLQTTSE